MVPPCLAHVADVAADVSAHGRVLVKWQLPMHLGAGQMIMLSILMNAINTLQQVCSNSSMHNARQHSRSPSLKTPICLHKDEGAKRADCSEALPPFIQEIVLQCTRFEFYW